MNNDDIVRELNKMVDTLTQTVNYFDYKDRMNAAMHMSTVRHTPLHSAVSNALGNCIHLMDRLAAEDGG